MSKSKGKKKKGVFRRALAHLNNNRRWYAGGLGLVISGFTAGRLTAR